MATQEQINIRKKWVEALRSGEYKQGVGTMRTADDGFCCLGVLCTVMDIPSYLAGHEPDVYTFYTETDRATGYLSKAMADKVGLASVVGGNMDSMSLAGMNDTGKTFAEIADIVESNPPGLFVD